MGGPKQWLQAWWAQGSTAPTVPRAPLDAPSLASNFWRELTDCEDPLSLLIESKANGADSHSLMLGDVRGRLTSTPADTSLLVLGPPRSVGKTSGVIIPLLLTGWGPVVSVSTKPDVAVATALHRRRQGRVWQFSPDGSDLMPGFEQLRWSPISNDWGDCLARASWMVRAADMAGDSRANNKFWESRASALLAVTLFYAGINGRSMEWVVEIIANYDISEFRPIQNEFLERGHVTPAKLLNGIVQGNDRTRGDIFATAAVVLQPYLLPGAIDVTTDPNFDVAAFVAGQPDERNDLIVANHPLNHDILRCYGPGQQEFKPMPWEDWIKQLGVYDTIYVSCSEENMTLAAPLIIGFLGDIRRQVLKQHRADELAGVTRRRAPVLWAIDELASVPIPELPAILRDAGSQGLLIAGALQSLSQTAKWGDEGKALQTLFNNILVLPGIRDTETLKQLSELVGSFDQEVWGGSYSGRGKEREWNASLNWQRRERLSVDQIYRGHPHEPDAALLFSQNIWAWISLQLYYRSGYWPVMVLASAEFAMRNDKIATQGLPFPDLARRDDVRYLHAIHPDLPRQFFEARRRYLEVGS